jgi:serine/threonine-protein kinase
MDAFPPPREPHYARLCAYLLKTQAAAEPPHPSSAAATVGPGNHHFEAPELQHIERHLAGYIGPLAKHLVKAAAAQAAGVEDLLGRLARELDSESERREFTERCQVIRPRTS